MKCPAVDREELVNACGVDDFHDGANVVRTACVVGMAKARDVFEPVLAQLGYRLAHVQRRMLPISMYLLQKEGAALGSINSAQFPQSFLSRAQIHRRLATGDSSG